MPELLLHVCCAPCSTHPINLLTGEFDVIAFFFNPNIYPPDEHAHRETEAREYFTSKRIHFILQPFQRKDWLEKVQPFADCAEGGERCRTCFELRLRKTAETASALGIRYFSTTLTIGPNKSGKVIFPIGEKLAEEFGLVFLARDFKKQNGYKMSCNLSKEFGMYRQNYCGCEYSFRDRNIRNSMR